MEEQEFKKFIEEQKQSGKSEEDIAKIFCLAFQEGTLNREQFEATLDAIGYELDDEHKAMSDEELKDSVIEKADEPEEGGVQQEEKIDPEGDMPPMAKEEDKGDDEQKEEKPEAKEEPEEEETDEEEYEKFRKMSGLKD